MGIETQNPLFKHFRQPQIHLRLPSGGRWWAPGSIEMPVTGEIPVYAMTAKDELTAKTPDALLNGSSTVDIIESCCPAIKNAWKMPAVDLDAIMIAIRIATYGESMEFTSVCPHCGTKSEHSADLPFLLSTIKCPDFDSTINIDGLEIYLKPHDYEEFNKNNIRAYEEQRLLSVVQNEDLSEAEKLAKFDSLFKSLVSLTIDQVVSAVAGIKADDVLVEDRAQLTEFFQNCNRPIWDAVKNKLQSYSEENSLKRIKVQCDNPECAKEYETPLVFEMSSFFG